MADKPAKHYRTKQPGRLSQQTSYSKIAAWLSTCEQHKWCNHVAPKQMARPLYGRRAIYFSREELTTGKPSGQKDWILFYLKEALDEFQDVWQVDSVGV